MVSLLTENSPKILHPKNMKIRLKEHQLTSIYSMYQLEIYGQINKIIKSTIYKFDILIDDSYKDRLFLPPDKTFKDINYKIETNFGILADMVGSGKTYTILGLLNYNLCPPEHEKILFTSTYNCLKYKDNVKAIKTNLIVVPHNLIAQWKHAFTYCNLSIHTICKKTDINILISNKTDSENQDTNNLSFYDVIICTATMFELYASKFKDIKYSRIIIDEICSIKLPHNINWDANFIWYITATPTIGIKTIKSIFIKNVTSKLQQFVLDNIIIKNCDTYINMSMNLPDIKQIILKCFTPRQLNIVREYIPNDIMEMLNAGDIQNAINKLNCNVDTNENIVQVVTNKIYRNLQNKQLQLEFVKSRDDPNKKNHEEQINKLELKIQRLQISYNSIKQRIMEVGKEICPICLEDFTLIAPVVLPCCNNLTCLPCLTHLNGKCSLCRELFDIRDINVISNNNVKHVSKNITKIETLIKIIKDKPNAKFLLFSNYCQTFENLKKKMSDEEITYSKLMGSGYVINKTLEKFNNGQIRVLMLNADNYGSGLNLQMATDIIIYHELNPALETQVIGRAQRMGRHDSLNVYYLLHEYEKNNIDNPTIVLNLQLDSDLTKLNHFLK